MYHRPVLINESIDGLDIKPDGIYVDATFGGGGHSQIILSELNKDGILIGIDQDKESKENLINDNRFKFIHGNFRFIKNYLHYLEIEFVDGVIADLGVSSHQFDIKDRGFSFRLGGSLDMRMNSTQELKASEIINNYSEEKLLNVFKDYCDIENPRKLTTVITENRKQNSINRIEDFVEIISGVIPKNKEIKYLAQVFQALRIEVNDEINILSTFLNACPDIIKPKGRLAVISYHSIEDGLVKNLIRSGNTSGEIESDLYGTKPSVFKAINKKIIIPKQSEIDENNRAKSAKLRIAERT